MRPFKSTGKLANRLTILLLLTTGLLANWQTVSYAAWGATVPNPIMEYQYTYDKNGNISDIYNAVAVSTSTFSYDEVNRLTQATGPYGFNNAQATQTYSYDSVGNIQGVTEPTKDLNGNATSYNNKTIEYDYENRPTKITDTTHNTITEFAYDYSGQRVYTKVSSGTITTEDYYVGNIYEEKYFVDSSSPTVLSSTTTVTYIYAGSIRVAGLTSQTTTTGTESNTLYYHGDHLGSSSIITDGSGTVVRNILYQPWGNEQSNTEESGAITLDPSHKFTGQILDDSTDLYYYGARYYDPQLRRFITPDIYVSNLYDPQSLNRYAYCRNNPVLYIDKDGNFFFVPILIGAAMGAYQAHQAGQDIWRGAILGGVLGGITGAGFLPGGVAGGIFSGGVLGGVQAAITGQDVGAGIIAGAITGGIGGAMGNIPVVSGQGAGAYLANAGIEITQEALLGGIRGGMTASLSGGNFSQGFWGGAKFGAIYGGAKVAMFGARYAPNVSDTELTEEYARQSVDDKSGINPTYPKMNTVSFRRGGAVPFLIERSITVNQSANIEGGQKNYLNNVTVLAHELRHVSQIQNMGVVPFYSRYFYESFKMIDQFYEKGNGTLEPYY